jgi:predicted kinase
MQSVARSLNTGTLMDVRQAHLILITGMPGTGKSTLAGSLARHLGVPLICKDTIKEPLLDVIGAADRAESRRLSDASFAVMFALARDCLRAGTDLILEGNFRPGEHESALSALIDDANATDRNDDESAEDVLVTQVLCRAPEHVRISRLKTRSTDPSRHPGHRDADLAVDVTLPDPVAGFAAGHVADVAADPAIDVVADLTVGFSAGADATADQARGRSPSAADVLELPGERFVFYSHADPAKLQALLKSIEQRHRDRPHV